MTTEASKYYDAIFFAKRFEGNAFVNVSYNDLITPAATSFAAIKELRAKTVISHSTVLDHSHPTEYWSGRFDFWRKNFPSMVNAPYFTDTGYWIEAGEDADTELGIPLDLEAQVFYNEDHNLSFPVKWEFVEGPGAVSFSNPNSSNSTVSFTESGIYTLKVTATDDSELEEEDFFHTVSDFVLIEVIDSQNPPVDSIQPTCILSFLEFDADGNVLIRADFSEPVTDLESNDFNITNGLIIDIIADEEDYILTIEPGTADDLIVSLPAGSVVDLSGNTNVNSNEISLFIDITDSIQPTCILSFLEFDADGNVLIRADFSEPVTDLESNDFNITNGLIIDIIADEEDYILTIEPGTADDLIVSLPAGSVVDLSGNTNVNSNEISLFVGTSSSINIRTNRVEIYPNPASSIFYLDLEKYVGESAKVKIYNELGQLLRGINIKEVSNEAQRIGTEGMSNGLFFITIELAEGVLLVERIIVLN